MSFTGSSIGKSGCTTDIGEIWNTAVTQFEKLTNSKVGSLASAKSTDDVLREIKNRKSKFSFRRHDGSKLDRLRNRVKVVLEPLQMWGAIITHATKTVCALVCF